MIYKNKNLVKDKRGQANVIILAIFTVIMGFGMLTIGSYLYYAIVTNADAGSQTVTAEIKASGSFAFNGSNFSSDQNSGAGRVTLTITDGTAVYNFNFNTTTVGTPQCHTTNCILVANVNTNNSAQGASNLTAQINANASTAAIVTATTSGNTTIVRSNLYGINGNRIVLSETITPAGQAEWVATSGTLTGGAQAVNGTVSQANLNNYVGLTFPLFGLALVILGFGVIILTMRKSFGSGENR
jgi:hypothetical protein